MFAKVYELPLVLLCLNDKKLPDDQMQRFLLRIKE